MAIDWKKILLGTGAVAGFAGMVFGGRYFYSLYKLSNELKVDKKGMIYKVSLAGITLRVIASIRNPTSATANLSDPMVEISYKGKTIAASKKVSEDFQIPKNDSKPMPAIDIVLDFMQLLTTAPDLVKEYRSTGKVTLTVDTRAKIDGWYNYKDIQDIPIGNSEGESISGVQQGWLLNDMRNSLG